MSAVQSLRLLTAAALVAGICSTPRAAAWNASGHMIVALTAYDQLDAGAKKTALELLHAHPRYADHLERAMPYEVRDGSAAEQDQWLFAFAATWPDVVRSADRGVTRLDVPKYNRPMWHFVDLPLYLNEAEQKKLAPTVRVNLSRDLPGDDDDPKMNVIQAIKNSTRIVGDKSAAAELRSIHLCWLLHLTGDSHQPLHSSALFTSRRFPEGDHGGNFFNASHGLTLHSFWDSQICSDEPYTTVRLVAGELAKNAELMAAGKQAAKSLDPGVWIDEGHELTKKYVYAPEVFAKISAREGHTHLGDLNPSPQYAADAETVAERQAAVAGHRLGKLLNQLLQ